MNTFWLTIIVLASIWAVLEFLFLLTHRHPLSEIEIKQLSKKRALGVFRSRYAFVVTNTGANTAFKSSLKPGGMFYTMDIDLHEFPSFCADLLKGKKHEWVVFAFEKDGKVILMWANKGDDRDSVSPTCSPDKLLFEAFSIQAEAIIRFHNHPNSNPRQYDCLLASEQDYKSSKYYANMVNLAGHNWVDVVCERGRFLKFFESMSESFCPKEASIEKIEAQNGQDWLSNYLLHREIGFFG